MQPKKELRNRARELELEGQPREALNHYQRLVERSDSPSPVLWYRIGDLQLELGETAAGLDSLSSAVAGFADAGEINNAIAMCCRVLEVERESPGAQLKLGELALQQGYRRDAADAFAAYNRWAVEAGDPSDAIFPLTAFLTRFPDDTELWRQWAEDLYARVGEEKTIGMLTDLRASLDGGSASDAIEAEIRVLRGETVEPPEPEAPEPAEETHADLPLIDGTEAESPDLSFGTLEGLEPTIFETEPRDQGEDSRDASLEVAAEEEGEDEVAGDLDLELHQPWESEEDEVPPEGVAGLDGAGDWDDAVAPEPLPELREPRSEKPAAGFDAAEMGSRLLDLSGASVDPDEPASHYDLGVAFKEMGLADQAIAHLAHALRGGHDPVSTAEVLGEILVESERFQAAADLLGALRDRRDGGEVPMIAIDYWLARSHEGLGEVGRARSRYEKVLAADSAFHDAERRLRNLGAQAL